MLQALPVQSLKTVSTFREEVCANFDQKFSDVVLDCLLSVLFTVGFGQVNVRFFRVHVLIIIVIIQLGVEIWPWADLRLRKTQTWVPKLA